MPRTSLSKIVTANVIESLYDVERFSLDWTKVKVGEIVHVINTGHFYVIKDVTELDNENGYYQLDGGPGGSVSSVGLAMPLGFSVANSPVVNSGVLTVTTTLNGIIKGNGSGFVPAIAGTDYENPLTFSGGVTRAANSITVDTALPLVRISSLVTNGFIRSSGGNGTLTIDTNTYLTASTGVTSISGTSGEISATAAVGAVTLSLPTALNFTGKTVTAGTFNSAFNGSIGATTPSTGVFTSITGSSLNVTGLSTLASGAQFSTSVSSNPGMVSFNSTRGLQIQAKTGSSYDFVLFSNLGLQTISVPTGTNDVLVSGFASFPNIINYSGGMVRSTSDTNVVNSTVLVNVSNLSFAVVAGATYAYKMYGDISQVGSAGYKLGIGGTATFSILRGRFRITPTTSSVIPDTKAIPVTESAPSGSMTYAADNTAIVDGSGFFTVTNAGTITIQVAGSATGAVQSVATGAVFEVWRIA